MSKKRPVFGTWGWVDPVFALREKIIDTVLAPEALSNQKKPRSKKATDAKSGLEDK